MDAIQPAIRTFAAQGRPDKQLALFGYALPHLPDLLADHTLLGSSDGERVGEILSRWTQFILGLRKWQGSAFALRYAARPQAGAVDVAIVGRARGGADGNAPAVSADLAAQLTAFGFAQRGLDEEALQRTLFPFHEASYIVEVRQHEELAPFYIAPQDAYVVHPFWGPSGSWLMPFETMLRQAAPVAVSLFLEPTTLTAEERAGFAQAAQVAQTLSAQMLKRYSEQSAAQLRDPQAELVSRIYSALTRQLAEAFVVLVQVSSPDAGAAWNVARAMGAAITARERGPGHGAGEQELPTGFDLRAPRNEAEAAAARRCFAQLAFAPWGNEMASAGKERLVYLAGPQGAAAVFRTPISVRGGVPGIAVRQSAPDFEPGPRPQQAGPDEVHLGAFRRGGAVTAQLKHLTRHALVTGFTGAGKTNTVLYLLDQLWRRHGIPFLVIEAAKKEYRGFVQQPGFEQALVFTLGDETTSPFRLNPFELLPGVRLEAHLGRLQTCFDAALPQFGILPSIVAESLQAIYEQLGWRLQDRGAEAGEAGTRLFPTMRDLLARVIQVAESRGYAGETYHNIRAAAAGRIGSLLQGSRGAMFNCQRSMPMDLLMRRPVVLELNDLNPQDKSLTMMFLLMLLREYRELHRGKTLQHVTVVEEAHNVMENVQSVGASEVAADTRAKAVEAFAAMLSEVRAYGEGIVISDQSPDKLAPDAVRNTNLQIAHQLRHRVDREAIAAAMIMTEAQQEYLGKLRVGEAAVFMTGYDRATFMQAPNFKDGAVTGRAFGEPDDGQVAAHMASFKARHLSAYLPYDGCRFCSSPCDYRELIAPRTLDPELAEAFKEATRQFDLRPQREYWAQNWRGVAAVCGQAAAGSNGTTPDIEAAPHVDASAPHVDAAWCYLTQEIDFPFTESMRLHFVEAFEQVRGG